MSSIALAAQALVAVKLLISTVPAANVPVTLTVQARVNDATNDAAPFVTREVTLKPGGETEFTLGLTEGGWTVQATGEDYWSRPVSINVRTGESPTLVLHLYLTAKISQSVEGFGSSEATAMLDFRGASQDSQVPEGYLVCPLLNEKLLCSLPVGVLDIRAAIQGFVPEYRWSQVIQAGKTNVLPPWRLDKGASVAGYVTTVTNTPSTGTTVELLTRSGDRIKPTSDLTGLSGTAQRYPFQAETNQRGFFQIRNVPTGDFQLIARRDPLIGIASARIDADRETRLRDFITLNSTADLQVTIEPFAAPDGTPWTISVVRIQPYRDHLYQRVTSPDQPTLLPLTAGIYTLEVWKAQERWHIETVAIEGPPPPVVIRLPITPVRGHVVLGSKPLAGRVTFGGFNGPMRIAITTDSEGRFEGTLPRDGNWVVSVEASDPQVRRTLSQVAVIVDATGEAHVPIKLPDTAIRGRVVDESGGSVRALVRVIPRSADDRAFQVEVLPNESFALRGLPDGEIRVEAEAPGGRRSDLATVTLAEGEEREVLLVIKGERTLEGRLVSTDGTPLAGGSVLAFQDFTSSPRYTTDAAGRFRLSLRPGTQQMTLVYWADGHAARMLSAVVSDDPLLLILERQGASLMLDFGREYNLFDPTEAFAPVLSSGGASLSVTLLLRLAAARGVLTEPPTSNMLKNVVLPQMSSGTYSLCMQNRHDRLHAIVPPPAHCQSGTVGPGGTLRLTMEHKLPSESR